MADPHAVPIQLSHADQATLAGWMRRRSTAQALALRARIVLACAEPGATNRAVAKRLGVCTATVAKWRGRFARSGLRRAARCAPQWRAALDSGRASRARG